MAFYSVWVLTKIQMLPHIKLPPPEIAAYCIKPT